MLRKCAVIQAAYVPMKVSEFDIVKIFTKYKSIMCAFSKGFKTIQLSSHFKCRMAIIGYIRERENQAYSNIVWSG